MDTKEKELPYTPLLIETGHHWQSLLPLPKKVKENKFCLYWNLFTFKLEKWDVPNTIRRTWQPTKDMTAKTYDKIFEKKESDPKYPNEYGAIENNRKDGNYTRRLNDTLLNEHSLGTKESFEDLWFDGNESQIYLKPLLTLDLS